MCFLYVAFQPGGSQCTWLVSDSPDVLGSPFLPVPGHRCPCFCLDTNMWTPSPGVDVEAGGRQNPAPGVSPIWAALCYPVLQSVAVTVTPGACHALGSYSNPD